MSDRYGITESMLKRGANVNAKANVNANANADVNANANGKVRR